MATTEIMLISEKYIRENSAISDNVAGKYIRAAIVDAQDVAYRRIIGDALLAKLKALVDSGAISQEGNEDYKALVDRSQRFLLYATLVELIPLTNFKVANAGVVKTPDEKVEVVQQSQVSLEQARYQSKADAAALDLRNYLLRNADAYPELGEGGCNSIRATLHSVASNGIFLGGARGKVITPKCKCK